MEFLLNFLHSDAGRYTVFFLMFAPAFYFDFAFKKGHVIGVSEALKWSAFWVVYAVLYGLFLLWSSGSDMFTLYLTAFFTEKALSIDNLFVFTLVFSAFGIRGKEQQTALGWGILGAIIARVILLTVGGTLLSYLPWLIYPLAGFLVYTGVVALTSQDEEGEEEPKGMQWAGKLNVSPLLACILVIELNDLIFAVDSIPAVLAISSLPLIAITSNIAAIQSLRSLFFVLEALKDKLTYLNVSIATVLTLIGAKMIVLKVLEDLFHTSLHINPVLWLAVVLGILTVGVLASIKKKG
jgi:tellurite resistance protein TerC